MAHGNGAPSAKLRRQASVQRLRSGAFSARTTTAAPAQPDREPLNPDSAPETTLEHQSNGSTPPGLKTPPPRPSPSHRRLSSYHPRPTTATADPGHSATPCTARQTKTSPRAPPVSSPETRSSHETAPEGKKGKATGFSQTGQPSLAHEPCIRLLAAQAAGLGIQVGTRERKGKSSKPINPAHLGRTWTRRCQGS